MIQVLSCFYIAFPPGLTGVVIPKHLTQGQTIRARVNFISPPPFFSEGVILGKWNARGSGECLSGSSQGGKERLF